MKKILITGASGFVGRNVYEHLLHKPEKYQIFAPGSRELDCLDEQQVIDFLKNHKFDVVLNYAAYGDGIDKSKDGTKICEYNLRIFLNFANHSELYGKMFYTGSGAEYDKRYPITMVNEEDISKSIPVDPYGLAKYVAGKLIEQSKNIYNLRLFGIFGSYEHWPTKFISNVCCKAIKGIPRSIRQNVHFDYLHVNDFCRMQEALIEKEELEYHTYNAVKGEPIDLLTICEIVKQLSGKDLEVFVCKEGLANEYTASNRRIMEELHGFTFTGYFDAISMLYAWYEQREKEIDILKLLY
jgi:GDP-L-fucose synthase